MKLPTGVPAVLIVSALATLNVGLADGGSGSAWVLVACATALPAIAAVNASRKGLRIGGREGLSWRVLAIAMVLMVPIYAAEFVGAYRFEDLLITAAYAAGVVAIVLVPLPSAGPYQRVVAALDALVIGVVVASGTFWIASGSGVDVAGHSLWAVSDATIMAMLGYVVVRRSQRRSIDWSLIWVITGVAAYLGGLLISSLDNSTYYLGHASDFAYVAGMTCFALAPLVEEPRREPSRNILKPVRWGQVLTPYGLAAVLAAAVLLHQVGVWSEDPTGTAIILGALVTMLLIMARQLAMIAEQRRKIDLEQRGVIATISHELRTPLTAVVGFLDLLEDWDLFSDAEKVEMVALMRDQSHILARVVGDLVDVAREKIEHLEVALVPVDVEGFIRSSIAHVPELARFDVEVNVVGDVGLTADRDRMLQILTNYLSNAAKYGSSRVEVVAFQEVGETVIEVHDDGPGVPDMFHMIIWERFERGPRRQSAIPGSGIGLSVARGIARSHGGETHYRRSERLGGSCFSVRVPRYRSVAKPSPPTDLAASAQNGDPARKAALTPYGRMR
jgi:signal transduction histidine kinase